MANEIGDAPVMVLVCATAKGAQAMGSVIPSAQNMLLAARALGLGSTLTSRHLMHAEEVEEILGLPPGVYSYAILPIGYPMGNFGPVRRGPLSDVVFLDRWGERYLDE